MAVELQPFRRYGLLGLQLRPAGGGVRPVSPARRHPGLDIHCPCKYHNHRGDGRGLYGAGTVFRKKSPQIHNYALIALYAGVYAYATFIHPGFHLRTIIMSVAMLIIFFQYLWLLWHRVDQLMYKCKENGRDQVCWEA